jgi:hypothetical protein
MATLGHLWGWPQPPQGLGVAIGPPLVDPGVARRHPRQPLGVARGHPLLFLKKISIFIYFLIIYLFIKMDTYRILIGLSWHLTEPVKNFNGI